MRSILLIAIKILVAAILAFVRDGDCVEAKVIVHPEPLNSTFGSTGAFHCTVVSDALNWIINGKSSNDPVNSVTLEADVNTAQRDNTYISTLTLRANTEENTTVQCVAVSYSGTSDFSHKATMLVQGLLDTPSNVTAVPYTENAKRLTWTPPFTLDITDLDPDITYTLCNNDTNTCVNTTDTSYIFHISTTKYVKFLVSACNPVGCSGNSTIIVNVTLNKNHHSTTGTPISPSTELPAIGTPPSPASSRVISPTPSIELPEILSSKEEEDSFGAIVFAGGAVGALLVVTTVVLVLIPVYISCKKKTGSQPVSVTDETVGETTDANILQTSSNSAYVTHQLRAQNIKLDKCPAYESVERCRDTS